jgi:biopolymer transport protein ExbD
MQQALDYRDDTPMMEINTTPLIDVMLVLLIMFIITIPIQTHAVKIDLPAGPPPTSLLPDPIKNEIVVTQAGQILWNGAAISMAGLRYNLVLTQRMHPTPELHLRPEPEARYEVVDRVLAITKQAQVEEMGFVGNDRYARF